MNADMKWLDNPEVFKVNQLEPHSDHCYYLDYSDMKKEKNPLLQSLNGQWEFAYSKNVMERPVDFYKETFDASGFDKIMVPGHIELAGYDTSTLCIRGKEKSTTEEHIVWRQPEQKKECSQKHSTIR